MKYDRLCVAMLLGMSGCALGAPIDWASPLSGYWDVEQNWSPAGVPGVDDDVTLGLSGPYVVFLRSEHAANSLMLTNPDARLDLLAGSTLSLGQGMVNDGIVRLNPKGFVGATRLFFDADSSILGSGSIRFYGGQDRVVLLEVDQGSTLTVGADQTLEGSADLDGKFVNLGRITASDGGDELRFLEEAELDNSGLVAVYSEAVVRFDETSIVQHGDGVLEAVGPGARFVFDQSDLVGGDVRTIAGGGITLVGASTISEARFTGGLDLSTDLSSIYIRDSVFEDADIVIRSDRRTSTPVAISDGCRLIGEGSIRLEASGSNSETLYLSEDTQVEGSYRISGKGHMRGSFVNRGGIIADVDGEELVIFNFANDMGVVSEAELEARDGGRLTIGSRVQQLPGSMIVSRGQGSVVAFELYSELIGGAVVTETGGSVYCGVGLRMQDVFLDGDILVEDREEIVLVGNTVNNGVITGGVTGEGTLLLEGDGEIQLRGVLGEQYPSGDDILEITQMGSHTIRGAGVIGADFTNYGLVSSDQFEEELHINGGSFHNESVVQAVGGGRLRLSSDLSQGADGVLRAAGPGSVIEFSLSAQGTPSVTGGEIRTSTGGQIRVDSYTVFRDAVVDADVLVDRQAVLVLGDGTVFEGVVDVPESDDFAYAGAVQIERPDFSSGGGVIRLGDPEKTAALYTLAPGAVVIGAGHRIEGLGRILFECDLLGTFAPGLPTGVFDLVTPIRLGENATLELAVAPSDQSGINSIRSFTLGGTLELHFIDGFSPDGYWARTVIEADGIEGAFDQIVAPAAPDGLVTRVYNTGTELIVGQSCLSDMNLDGVVDFFDVSVFVEYFGSGSLQADLNGDGALDFFDVSAFLVAYQGGCP